MFASSVTLISWKLLTFAILNIKKHANPGNFGIFDFIYLQFGWFKKYYAIISRVSYGNLT